MKKKAILITTAMTATLSAAYFSAGEAIIMRYCRRKKRKKDAPLFKYPISPEEQAWIEGLSFENFAITSFDGLTLRAKLLKADQPSDKVVIAVHGYHSFGLREFGYYLRFYHELGYHILLPDNRAHGDSDGTYVGWGYLDRLDVMEWINMMQRYFDYAPLQIVLHGISMGAATVLMASGEKLSDDVKCIIADCGYANLYDQFKVILKKHHLPTWLLPGARVIAAKQVGMDYKKANVKAAVARSHTPTLFIHGDQDEMVPDYMSYILYNACQADKDLLIVEGAKHAQSFFANPELYKKTVTTFLSHHVL